MLISNLNLLATAPDDVAKLRELILTLVVQGKPRANSRTDLNTCEAKYEAGHAWAMASARIQADYWLLVSKRRITPRRYTAHSASGTLNGYLLF
ncbi:MAG: hypothetical protein Q7T63_05105 [Burkholderiaceae bacterium]|nr:hypothetical protein [Burkholderiaceae bacterium]